MKVGEIYGRLEVTALLPDGRAMVRCTCGVEKSVRRGHLCSGHSSSCGCLKRELSAERLLTHGHVRRGAVTPEYRAWTNAKTRTTNPARADWGNYGGRDDGHPIAMAPEWLDDFPAFLAHIGPKPSPELSLDRVDNELGYAPGNVKWSSRSEQNRNRRPRRRRGPAANINERGTA